MKKSIAFLSFLAILPGISLQSADHKPMCSNGVCSFDYTQDNQAQTDSGHNAVTELYTEKSFCALLEAHESKPVVISLYHPLCKYCTEMKPIFQEIAQEHGDFVCATLNGHDHPGIMKQFNVSVYPSFLIFKNGILWGKIRGKKSKDKFLLELDKIISSEMPISASKHECPTISTILSTVIIVGLLGVIIGAEIYHNFVKPIGLPKLEF